ncbi:MAG: multiheme c-type cytochrome [Bryobacteraceae bacterium]
MMFLLLAQAVFTGNQACAPCHKAIFASYQRTPMARSSGVVSGRVPPGTFRHSESAITYTITEDGTIGGRKLDYFIGSGEAGISYLYSLAGFLFQAPVTWYSQKGRWDMSPGYEHDHDPLWNRAVTPNCLFCHASQARPIYGTENQYADPPFAQNGVACERCHGPGSEHVKGSGRMVNPSRLDAARRDSVCAQCHLSGEARVERAGKAMAMYRAGDLLEDYASYFVLSGARSAGIKATGYVEKLAESRCKQVSGDRLWCGSCHDPHTVPVREQRVGYFRAKCLTCHEQPHSEGGGGPDCMNCHMPRARVVDGGHGILTDHSIPKRPRKIAFEGAGVWKLEPFLGGGEARELGLAYAEVGLRTGDRRQQDEAIRLLSSISVDPEVAVRLGDLLQRKGNTARAEQLYALAPNSIAALVNLGGIYGARGEYSKAIKLWRSALEKNPGQREASLNLALTLRSLGLADDAAKVEASMRRFQDRK